MRAAAVLTVAYATLAFAQSNNSSRTYTAEDLGPWFGDVSESQKRNWCLGQTNTCRELCRPDTNTNDCDPITLQYECVCADDTTPELKNYAATLPTHICQYVYDRCTDAHPNDLAGKQACEDAWNASCHPDNLLNASDGSGSDSETTSVGTTTTTSESSESTGDASSTSSADGSDATPDGSDDGDDGSFAAPTAVPVAGAAAFAMGLVAYLI